MRGSDVVVAMLEAYEVEYVFGLPGDTSTPFYDALGRAAGEITHIMARDERSAGFMADAYARTCFKPGVCEGPSGGGATYMLPGVAEANDSSIPLVVLTTDNPLPWENREALTELDQESLFRPVTKWTAQVKAAAMIPRLMRRAFRLATSGRPGAVHLSFPKDVLEGEAAVTDLYAERQCIAYPSYRSRPSQQDLEEALDLLSRSVRPVIVAGGGVLSSQAWDELTALTEQLQIPVATTINGKGSIVEADPLSLGVIGGNGGRPYANQLLREADLVFFIGSKVNYVDTANWSAPPLDGRGHIVQLDVDSGQIGNNYPIRLGLAGDAACTLSALVEIAQGRCSCPPGREAWLSSARELRRLWWKGLAAKMTSEELPIRPQRIVGELRQLLPQESVVVADPGTPTPFVAAMLELPQPGRRTVIPRAHGGLGYALPGVVGAKLACPQATVVGLCGDGSFGMAAGELETIHRLGVKVILLQFNNGCFGWIKELQHLYHGGRYFSVDFSPDTDYVGIAGGFGLWATRVERPNQLAGAIEEALEVDEAAFIDVVCASPMEETPPVASWLNLA